MVDFLRRLVLEESPSTVPEAQAGVQRLLRAKVEALGYEVRLIPGKESGGHLLAQPTWLRERGARQLLVGHSDTVWPVGTSERMPVRVRDGKMSGPGVYDMKAGLVQMLFALEAVQALSLELEVAPVVFVNSDEEVGSPESTPHVEKLAQEAERAFVLEPSLSEAGLLKTARKGVGRFWVTAHGKAAHAGLDPEKGRSAILELARVVQTLSALTDLERGVTVNVGKIQGGTRSNVIAEWAEAEVDVRVPRVEDALEIEAALHGLQPMVDGVHLEVRGAVQKLPLERTQRNRKLWRLAQELGAQLGMVLEEGAAGGGSDGNTTSRYTATLDGLGAVGDGAHAAHEFIYVDKMVERAALLAMLLLAPAGVTSD